MKKPLLLPLVLFASGATIAQEVGHVISATPIIQQVVVPRQFCTTEQVTLQQPKSGAGALLGAIAGGAMGNAVGGGAGKVAATMIGVIGGAVVGDNIEGGSGSQVQNIGGAQHKAFMKIGQLHTAWFTNLVAGSTRSKCPGTRALPYNFR